MHQCPVVVVGGGPVGMGLTLQLSKLGVPCLIVNKEPDSGWHPRGNTHNSRTMEHYRRLGLSDGIRALGMPQQHPTDVGYFTTLSGPEIARIPMPSEAEKKEKLRNAAPDDQVVEPIFRCNQMYVERFLLEQILSTASIECKFGWECINWEDQGDRVRVGLAEVSTSKRTTIECQYLVGCDGGQSIVRKNLGIRYAGDPYRDQAYAGGLTASTFIRAPNLYKTTIRKLCWQYSVVNHLVRSNLVTLDGEGHFLFSTRLRPRENESEKQAILRQLAMSIGAEVRTEYISHFLWTAGQALVAESYGSNRVIMAGDAVHLFTPQGGFGMNTGVDDAANLAWKLAALVQGWGGPRLLETYEQERRPIAIRNTSAAQAMARQIGDVPVGDAILEDTEKGAEARIAAGNVLSKFTEEFASIGIQLGARYDKSPIVTGDGLAPADPHDEYIPSASPGGRAPHFWLPGRVSIFDLFDKGFTLLCLRRSEQDAADLQMAAARHRIPLTVLPIDSAQARDLYETDFALIRPDQHVAWRGNKLPDNCDGLLTTACGWH
jgi:2-polyprenyl-6-methoxyphenol hydroxylase-like FAD-dependent oxidoreductase